jgi:hypothetical protein
MTYLATLMIGGFVLGYGIKAAWHHPPSTDSLTVRVAITALGLAVLILALLIVVIGAGWMLAPLFGH